MPSFATGSAIALRNVWEGRIVSARPVTVVHDDPTGTTLYVPLNVACMAPVRADGSSPRIPSGEWSLRARRWDAHVLSFAWPGVPDGILLFWDPDWRPRHWYVNLQGPLRRTTVGFDYTDLILDVVMAPDRSAWEWKDEDELEQAIGEGLIPAADVPRLREGGERAVRRILDREPPFDRDWWDWRPDPSWPLPELPAGWDEPAPSG